MTTGTGSVSPGHIGTSMLEQLAGLDERSLSPQVARAILNVGFDASYQERVHDLSEKARRGSLEPAEAAELDESIRVGDLLAILQSKARRVLRRSASSL